jgi:DNA polymerase III delta prime subunit
LPRAQYILQAEGVFLPDANVLRILATSTGDIRQTCRALQDTVLTNMAPPAMPAVSLEWCVNTPNNAWNAPDSADSARPDGLISPTN